MDRATYWATKSPLPEFWAVTFDHPAFTEAFRLVCNVFEPVTLGGYVHQPAPMTIKPPDSKGDAQPRLSVTFPRQVVGTAFKRELRRIQAVRSRSPIECTFSVYLGDTSAPQIVWPLYVSEASGIAFSAEAVQVTATLDNPMLRSAAVIYDPAVWTGLASV